MENFIGGDTVLKLNINSPNILFISYYVLPEVQSDGGEARMWRISLEEVQSDGNEVLRR
jgi:hypothetical protein